MLENIKFNEDTRVKYPALIHFTRLGYNYVSKKDANIDIRLNIFKDIFKESIERINNRKYSNEEIKKIIDKLNELSQNTVDKGKSLYEGLKTNILNTKLIDFNDYKNNNFSVVTELTFSNEYKEFRPDIVILINGIPLSFLEVKKPNNNDGINAEINRMNYRLQTKEFDKFMSLFQVISFSNNMEYEEDSFKTMQGSFYSTPNKENTTYNLFREEELFLKDQKYDLPLAKFILKDNNQNEELLNSNEFKINSLPTTHTNSFITSLYSIERIMFILEYGIKYIEKSNEIYKHIIRYPQLFAAKNILETIDKGMKNRENVDLNTTIRTICWMTQGSGKTALTEICLQIIRDYFQKMNIQTKFFFVVDRLDLSNQAKDEFSFRNLNVEVVDSKNKFVEILKSIDIQKDINVVNIQKFSKESIVNEHDMLQKLQRIYFLDEVHRSYNPEGCFLSNLLGADKEGIFIGLTGTPIIKDNYKSTDLFGDYCYKYYYNTSIDDGYTLSIKREIIELGFKEELKAMYNKKNLLSRDWNRFMEEEKTSLKLIEYINNDFKHFKETIEDDSLGFMIVASSTKQAKLLQRYFEEKTKLKTALVLSSSDDEDMTGLHLAAKNKQIQNHFKKSKEEMIKLQDDVKNKEKELSKLSKEKNNTSTTKKIEKIKEDIQAIKREIKKLSKYNFYDGLIVYQMLSTGYDCPRLKRMYLLRDIKEHNLLQTLTRVNRPYKNIENGYVVDFVDIEKNYDYITKKYAEELHKGLNEDEIRYVDNLFINIEDIINKFNILSNEINRHPINNLENFSNAVNRYSEFEIKKLHNDITKYFSKYNELKISYQEDIIKNVDYDKMKKVKMIVNDRLDFLRKQKMLENKDPETIKIDISNIIFNKIGEDELDFKTLEEENHKLKKLIDEIQGYLNNVFDKNNELYIKYSNSLFDISIEIYKKNTLKTSHIYKDKLNKLLDNVKLLNINTNDLLSFYEKKELVKIHNVLLENIINVEIQVVKNIVMNLYDVVCSDILTKGNIRNQGKQPELTIKANLYKFLKENNIKISKDALNKISHDIIEELK